MNGVLMGSVALTLCILAVAILGLTMLWGRIPLRRSLQVVLGCFIILGAPILAAALQQPWSGFGQTGPSIQPPQRQAEPGRPDLPPADYDPYAGAAMPVDR